MSHVFVTSSYLLFSLFTIIIIRVAAAITSSTTTALPPAAQLLASPDAPAILAFKSKADLHDNLPFLPNKTFHVCQWPGVKCYQQKIVRLVLQDLDLGGIFAPRTLTSLDQLRVLGLQNNSLTGPIPYDLSKLTNLKSLFLDHNFFSGSFPLPVLFLHRLRTLDFSYNLLTGPIPSGLISLDRLYYLRLDRNQLNGSMPPLNQSSLVTLNVSFNNLSGAIPVTPTLLRFGIASFLSNPSLCGEIINKECHPGSPFFGPSLPTMTVAPPPAVLINQNQELQGVDFAQQSEKAKHKRSAMIIGLSSGALALTGSVLCFMMAVKRQKNHKKSTATIVSDGLVVPASESIAAMQIDEQENELKERVERVQGMHVGTGRSGSLAFCAGEAHLYTLDQLMRASAELLGRGTMGTTYKAVLDNRLIVSVKRLDASRLKSASGDIFEQHMESVGGLRHPNLVPLRAYFQAREERLLIYDYQPNGSLFSLVHGSKSTGAKPLHWTSCLKIAEDVAQGLSYIHQAWRLVHGNLKSSNVLLGPDFEACVGDYCLAVLADPPIDEDDPDIMAYRAPETRSSSRQATSKSDVYAFGLLLLELLTGKPPSQQPISVPHDMVNWVRSARDHQDGGGGEDDRLEMLLEVAIACSLTSPEQRPTMWQVLKMLQEIKETVLVEDSAPHAGPGTS